MGRREGNLSPDSAEEAKLKGNPVLLYGEPTCVQTNNV